MDAMDTELQNDLKRRLLEEKGLLEKELSRVGRKNPKNPNDWEPTLPPTDPSETTEKGDAAERMTDFEEIRATEITLELRLQQVKKALSKFQEGTYGLCEKGNHPISVERLKANPAATTCREHAV